jgi:hypothetical protein
MAVKTVTEIACQGNKPEIRDRQVTIAITEM